MKIINFQGLNCYHNCVVSIAASFGVDYPESFATLWSETDFRYDPIRETYMSKNIVTNLETLGAELVPVSCSSPEETASALADLDEGECIVVGMDAYHIPWNQFCDLFHGPHYFIARNVGEEKLLCYDPTYYKKGERLTREDFIRLAFDAARVYRVGKGALGLDYRTEAQAVLRSHPPACETLLERIDVCRYGAQEETLLLAKYVDAMINNRYLFRHYLEKRSQPDERKRCYLNSDFLMRWFSVKNGLYKATLGRDNGVLVREISSCFKQLMDEELAMAGKMAEIS